MKYISKSLEAIKNFTVGASFMIVFGIIDNVGLFIGMEVVEDKLMTLGYDSQIAAGIGNTFSDALGALMGGIVAVSLHKLLKIKGEGTIPQQFIGVIIGCLIPVAVKILI